MSETPLGHFSYPVSTDLIADGAADMQDLAGDVDKVLFLATNALSGDQPWSDYPIGQTLMYTTGDTWPYTSGMVMSYRAGGGGGTVVWQNFVVRSTIAERQRVYTRLGYTPSGGSPRWSEWQVVASLGTAEEQATGSVTITPAANTPTPVNVAFPSNRFSKNPRVFLQYQGTQPQDVFLSTYNRSPTGFRAYVYRPGTTSVTFHWYAVVMESDLADN